MSTRICGWGRNEEGGNQFSLPSFSPSWGFHLYWAAGGRWGFESTLPTDAEGQKMLAPGIMASAVVGLGLLALALFYTFKLPYTLNP